MRAEDIDGVPDEVDWPSDLDVHWRDRRPLISQTCGYPLVTRLAERVQVLGAFRYVAPGCAGILCRSFLVVRDDATGRTVDDFRDRIAAINDRHSYSGCHALRTLVAPLARAGRFFAREIESGSHRHSLALLRDGRADIAAVDCISLAALQRHSPALLRGLRIIGATGPASGLPLVTSVDTPATEVRALRRALAAASEDASLSETREALFIGGFEIVAADRWNGMVASTAR